MDETSRCRTRRWAIKLLTAAVAIGPMLTAHAYAQWPSEKVIRIVVPREYTTSRRLV